MPLEELGPYSIVRTLGRGGMGAVYEGVHRETGERVAIKVLSPAYMDDPGFRDRFSLEIQALKTLTHAHIVRLTGYGEQEGRLFYTMELVPGQSLQQRLNDGYRFSWDETIKIALQVCSALKHAHDHGIIHRDLKPANLISGEEDQVKLADFGIAKVFGAAGQTVVGGVIGTAEYMAPEQARGLPVSPRSDLFSLGSVMYALLTGHAPFEGASRTGVLRRLVRQAPDPIRNAAPDTPPQLVELIEHLMQKEPERRIPSAANLMNQLRALQHGLQANPTSESGPPEADDFELDQEDATLVPGTPIAPKPTPSHYWRETIVADADELSTVAGTKASHYTSVGEGGEGRAVTHSSDTVGEHGNHWLSIVGIVASLVAIAGLVWYASLPPTVDKLYSQIAVVANNDEESALIDVKAKMRRFLELYPEDPRARR